jgi:citrate synthase
MVLDLARSVGAMRPYETAARIADHMASRPRPLLPNVDFYLSLLYTLLGIPRSLFTPLFVVARAGGWLAHIMEQLGDNRLIRPRAEYTGPRDARWLPIERRG